MTLSVSFDLEETRNGWVFRFPANDETALWRGPFPDQTTAQDAAIAEVEAFMTYHAAEMLGLAN